MKKQLYCLLICLFSILPFFAHSTHIVGGSLTYIYNGGSNYTVTLKLYRECGAGAASFPATVTVNVLGYNGAAFTPSKDMTMSLGTVTSVPSNLPPCASAPNPMPCTQEGIYTTNVNNLPPNPGGYHLYYQIVARNLTISNVNTSGNNIGESFYAYIPGLPVHWGEDFALANGTTIDNGSTAWSIAAGSPAPASASVSNNLFQITGADNARETWTSQVISISAFTTGVNLRVDLSENGNLDTNDSIFVYYRLNGGPLTLFSTNGFIADDFTNAVASQTTLIGNTVQIIIRVHYDANSPNSETYRFDNVFVYGNNFSANHNPVFNQFPPLFLCKGLPFTFDHSATDANGDSLVYSFYTPYNGENGAGPLDPTFPNNTAVFTPVVWQPGFSATNPLGGGALSLNSSTGLLSGTPSVLGQFVVGIAVKEYRNGVLLSETLRDCQFNVINCPQTLAVIIGPQNPSVCFGGSSTTITAIGSGGTTPYTYLWNGVNPAQTINVGAGTYTVMLTDASGCQVYAYITVTSYSVAITANAGADQTVCSQNPLAVLNGSVSGASGGIWSGGAGVFSPNNTTLSGVFYTPTAAELTAGFVNLTLTTTGNGTCPPGTDVVTIYFMGFSGAVSVTAANVSCYGSNNGSATVTITGGLSPYTYFWNTVPAQTTATASNLSPGTYSVTSTNSIGCTAQSTVAITQPPPLAVNSTITNVSCFGGNNGAVTANAVGGTPGYTYLWNPSAETTANISNLSAGSYTLTISDSQNCQYISTYTITQPPLLSTTLSSVNVSCFNGSNGFVNSTATGGTAPYTYNWDPIGATSPNVSGLPAGTYTVTVTDKAGCIASNTVVITQPTVLTSSIANTNETCNYLNNGTAAANVSGGTSPYTYNWQPGGQSTPAVSNLPTGTYTLTVTDSAGCNAITLTTITEPASLSINFINQTNVSCFGGNNGAVTANVTGGTPGYTYSWNPIGQTTANVSNISSGTYTLTVTDNNGCQIQNSVLITQPIAALSVTATATGVSCPGGTNGTVSSSASGGTGAYTYSWQVGSYTGQSVSNVIAGTYTVTTTDANGCIASNTVTVTQPPVVTLTISSANSTCNLPNGQASVTVSSGGVVPYTYSWSGGQTTSTATGLASGTYTVVVTDASGCTTNASASINDVAAPILTVFSTTNVSCYGGSNGSATVNISGGTAPFTYSWSPYGGTSNVATGLAAGTYVATVQDANGCKSSVTINPVITQPPAVVLAVSTGVINCFGGGSSASVSASGGTPGYTYTWLPGGSTGNAISGLTASTYTAQVTDANSCVQTSTFSINQPAPLTSTIVASSNVSCFGGNNGTAAVGVSGGTPFYTYSWMLSGGNGPTAAGLSAGTYTVTIVDSKGCTQTSSVIITQPTQSLTATGTSAAVNCWGGANGSAAVTPAGGTPAYTYQWSPAGGTGQTASGLTAGTYYVFVTDANGCQSNVTLAVSEPSSAVNGTLVPVNPSCGLSNGSISSQVSGGSGSYSYLWTPGSSTSSGISGVGPGNYTLQVTDAAGCTAIFTAVLTNIPGPTAVVSVNNVSCFGGNNGTATVTITQGTAPYLINWLPYGGNSLSATALISGTYAVNVTDALGCTASAAVAVTEPPPVTVSISSVTAVSCNGGNNGAITVSVSGGTPSYAYIWSNGQTTSSATNLSAGNYTVNMSDQNNCPASISIKITEPQSALASSISAVITPICYGGYGSATVIVSGGTIPYSYSWSTSPVQTANSAVNLSAGSYTVTVTDANGCTSTSSVTITQPTEVITTAGPNDTICILSSPVILTATASGGAGNYYYAWQPSGIINSGTLNITPSSSTTYTVIAYDQNGCPGTPDTVSAIVYSLLPANVQAISFSPICPGQTSVVYVQTSGSTGSLTYLWGSPLDSTGPGAYLVTPTQATTYIVTVTNHCGTSVTDSVQVILNPPPSMSLTSDTNSSCVPAVIQFFDNSVSGNVSDSITSWYWNFGDNTFSTLPDPPHVYTQPGTYTVVLTVTTIGGCSNNNGSAPLIISVFPSPIASFTTSPSVTPINIQPISFINQSSGATSYFWDFGDGGTSIDSTPQHHFPTKGFYTVTLITTNQYGCTDTFLIQTTGEGGITFPNAFTPDPHGPGGGVYNPFNLDNNVFFPFAWGVQDFHMMIFNRWGELLFETFDINIGWDGYYRGKLCQQDVYVWKAFAKFMDGKTVEKAGDVTLLR